MHGSRRLRERAYRPRGARKEITSERERERLGADSKSTAADIKSGDAKAQPAIAIGSTAADSATSNGDALDGGGGVNRSGGGHRRRRTGRLPELAVADCNFSELVSTLQRVLTWSATPPPAVPIVPRPIQFVPLPEQPIPKPTPPPPPAVVAAPPPTADEKKSVDDSNDGFIATKSKRKGKRNNHKPAAPIGRAPPNGAAGSGSSSLFSGSPQSFATPVLASGAAAVPLDTPGGAVGAFGGSALYSYSSPFASPSLFSPALLHSILTSARNDSQTASALGGSGSGSVSVVIGSVSSGGGEDDGSTGLVGEPDSDSEADDFDGEDDLLPASSAGGGDGSDLDDTASVTSTDSISSNASRRIRTTSASPSLHASTPFHHLDAHMFSLSRQHSGSALSAGHHMSSSSGSGGGSKQSADAKLNPYLLWKEAKRRERRLQELASGGKRSIATIRAMRPSEKLRIAALQCVQVIAYAYPQVFGSSDGWSLLPTDSKSALSQRPATGLTLLSLILFDSSSKVRVSAANALASIFLHSPIAKILSIAAPPIPTVSGPLSARATTAAVVAAASASPVPGTAGTGIGSSGGFSSLSSRIIEMLTAIHAALLEAVIREKNDAVLTHILKSVTVIVSHTPYQHLPSTNHNSHHHSHLHHHHITSSQHLNAFPMPHNGLLVPFVVHLLSNVLAPPAPTFPGSGIGSGSGSSASNATNWRCAAVASGMAGVNASGSDKTSGSGSGGSGSSSPDSVGAAALMGAIASTVAASTKSNLRAAAFACLSQIFDTPTPLLELHDLLSGSCGFKPTGHGSAPPTGVNGTTTSTLPTPVPVPAVIQILLTHAFHRGWGDPTPDAYTVLSKIARNYRSALAVHWIGITNLRAGSISLLIRNALLPRAELVAKMSALKVSAARLLVSAPPGSKLLVCWCVCRVAVRRSLRNGVKWMCRN